MSESSQLQNFRYLVEHQPDGILVIDRAGIVCFANPAAAALLERTPEELIGTPLAHPLALDQRTELTLRTRSGQMRIVDLHSVSITWNDQPAHLVTLHDVTERSQAQQRLQYRLALESLLAKVSARFVSLPIAEVDEQINDALAELAQFIGAERAVLIDLTAPTSPFTITHLWEAPHIIGRFPLVYPSEISYRFYAEAFAQQDVLIIPDAQALPAEHPARDFLTMRGVRTLMAVAMRDGEMLRGSLLFASISQPRDWQHEDAALLSIAADVFASTLRRAEINRALRESEARLRFVISNAPLILFTFDTNGAITFLEGSLLDELHPKFRSKVSLSALDVHIGISLRHVLQGEAWTVTFAPDAERVLEARLKPLYDDRRQVVGGIGIIVDITARQRAQQSESQKTFLLQTLAEAAAKLTSSLEMQHVLDAILEYAERLVPCDGSTVVLLDAGSGYVSAARGRSSHMIHERWATVFARMDVQAKLEHLRQAGTVELIPNTDEAPNWLPIEGTEWIKSYLGLPIEVEERVVGLLNFDSATPNFFTQEHVERLQTLVGYAAIAIQNANLYSAIQRNAKDLERHVRQRTHELELERARLRAILDAMEDAVIFFELQVTWRAVYINPAFQRLLGYDEPEIIGRSVTELEAKIRTLDTTPSFAELGQALEREGYWQRRVRPQRKDGSAFDALVTAGKVADARGRFVGIAILVRDVSAEVRLQAQKDRFIANAAHELRTPLTNLKMRLYLLRRQPEAAEEHLRVLEQVTRRIQALVEDLLDITRFERGMITLDRETICLQDLLTNVLQVQRPHFEEKGVQLCSEMPAERVLVLADAERLVQVFTNLLVNALNYTQAQGSVCVRLHQDAAHAQVEVQDTGSGIDSESIKHIFEPFFRANLGTQRGTGLGLTIAREIVQAHGGTIEAHSEVGKGTTMTVRLPLAQR